VPGNSFEPTRADDLPMPAYPQMSPCAPAGDRSWSPGSAPSFRPTATPSTA